MKYKRNNLIYTILMFAAICFAGTSAHAQRKYLFTWDEGSGTTMPGWTWSDDVAYGHPGWTLNADGPFGGGKTYMWGYGPRSFEKNDNYTDSIHPFSCMVDIVKDDISPASPSTGGALKVFDDGNSNYYRAGWWLWYDGEPLSSKGLSDDATNRWSFYIKASGIPDLTNADQFSFPNNTMTVGTYLCWNDGDPVYGQGDGCPYEGPGNQHYYHYLTISPEAWIHVSLDQHPQWLRNAYIPSNDPVFSTDGKHYFNQLHQFYIEISGEHDSPTSYLIDEMNFHSTTDTAEPNQNDESICSVWVGYWPDKDKWQIGWQKGITYSSGWSTYEIRWSTSPITNENFAEANPITPEYYGGVVVAGPGGEHLIREPDSYRQPVWTQFELPDDIENNYDKLYFAIKDVSIAGAHIGSRYPYASGDHRDSPSSFIRTIDYILPSINISKPRIESVTIH